MFGVNGILILSKRLTIQIYRRNSEHYEFTYSHQAYYGGKVKNNLHAIIITNCFKNGQRVLHSVSGEEAGWELHIQNLKNLLSVDN